MQACEMRIIRTLFSRRGIFILARHRSVPNSTVVFSNYGQQRSLSCHLCYSNRKTIHSSSIFHGEDSSFHLEGHRSSSGSNPSAEDLCSSCGDENPSITTVYDPSTDSLVTRRASDGNEIGVHESSSEDENRATLSSLGSVVENLSPKSSGEGVRKIKDERDTGGETARSWSVLGKQTLPVMEDKNSVSSGSASSARDFASKKKKSKSKTYWVCANCGDSSGQWWGICRSCRCTGTLKQFSSPGDSECKVRGFDVSENAVRSWLPQKPAELRPQRLTDVNKGINELNWRIPLSGLFGNEVARVLGGGIVPGSLVLVGGDPGVGKSTLLLQIAAMIAEGHDFGGPAPVVYVSGEESVEQIGNRADRMRIGTGELFLYSSTDIEDILEKIQILSPRALIVDSIQTVYLKGVTGSPGGLQQVKECTSALLRFAKKTSIPVLLIGHVTKTGDIAGPRVLEHIVDVVLYMEGEKYSSHRFLRSVKNRFGSTDELGVFEMSQSGLEAVANPSEIFLSEQHSGSDILAGLAVAVVIDGSRTFLVEIQALCLSGSSVERQFNGVQSSRADMIIAVLMKQTGLKLQDNAIFINVVSGVKVTEPAGDLAIAAAICSSFLEFPIPNNVAFIGEIGLGGEIRPIARMEKRINALAKLGYKKCIVPKSTEKLIGVVNLDGMTLLGCRNMKEVIHTVFTSQ